MYKRQVIISADKDAVQSSKITNEFAKRLGMSEEQLFKCAAENTRRLFPPVVRSMNDIMKEMFARDGMPQEIADMMIAELLGFRTIVGCVNLPALHGYAFDQPGVEHSLSLIHIYAGNLRRDVAVRKGGIVCSSPDAGND